MNYAKLTKIETSMGVNMSNMDTGRRPVSTHQGERDLRRNQACLHFGLGLPASGIVGK